MLHGYDIKITDEDLNDSDKEEKKEDWTEEAYHFVKDFIYGVEGSAYKKAALNNEIKILKEEGGFVIGMKILEFYLGQVYNQLTQKTNPLIVSKFIRIGNICNEKPHFMLIIASKVIKTLYPRLPRAKFDIEDDKKYSQSVLQILISMRDLIISELKDSLKEFREAKKTKKTEIENMEDKMKNPK